MAPLSSRQIVTRKTYDLKEWLPAGPRKALGTKAGRLFTTNAAEGEKIAPGGPFPVVVFSHGLAGFRVESAFLTTHLASWGFIVIAPDHPGHSLTAVLSSTVSADATSGVNDLAASVVALGRSPLRAGADLFNLAVIGRSTGGDTAIRWGADEPRVQGIVVLAGGVGAPRDPLRPILFMAAANDQVVRAQSIQAAYRSSQSPKRLIMLNDSGHLSFTDVCTIAADPGGLWREIMRLGAKAQDRAKVLLTDGCSAPNAPFANAWPVVNSSVVAQLRSVFGSGTPGFALDQTTLDALASRGAVKSRFTIG